MNQKQFKSGVLLPFYSNPKLSDSTCICFTLADRMTGFGIINKSPVECQIPLACEDRTYSLQNKKLNSTSKSSIGKTNKQVAETLYIKVRCTSFDMPTRLTVNTNKLGLKIKIR
jgi:hypothetical protein